MTTQDPGWECKHCGRRFGTRAAMYSHSGKCIRRKHHSMEKNYGFTVKGNTSQYLVIPTWAATKRELVRCLETLRIELESGSERQDELLHYTLWIFYQLKKLNFIEISKEEYDDKSKNSRGIVITSIWPQAP